MEASKLIKADGTIKEISPKNNGFFGLEELQELVGGYIEVIYLPSDTIMIVNEEGKLKGLPTNLNATKILYEYYKVTNILVGDVVLTSRELLK